MNITVLTQSGKSEVGGLLHDYAKIIKISELEEVIRKEYSGELLENILEVPATYHSFAGAYYIKEILILMMKKF